MKGVSNRIDSRFRLRKVSAAIATTIALGFSLPVAAKESVDQVTTHQFTIQSQSLAKALLEYSKQTNIDTIAPSRHLNNIVSRSVTGNYSVEEALRILLQNSGMTYEFQSEDVVLISEEKEVEEETEEDGKKAKSDTDVDEEIVVTGSKIIKDPTKLTRQVETYTREEIERSGVTRLDEFLQRVPQNINAPNNFASGDYTRQDFGAGANVFAGSSANLRGLGSQYTLILIDGRRPARGGQYGEITDISSIPLSQIERIEILFDGAAAQYGADAVGGVINIITSRDYEGLETSFTYEETQRGGGQRINASIARTTKWENGSFSISFDYQGQKSVESATRPELNFIQGALFTAPPASPGNVSGAEGNDGFVRPIFYVADINGDGDTLDVVEIVNDQGETELFHERISGGARIPSESQPFLVDYDRRDRRPEDRLDPLLPVDGLEWQPIYQAAIPELEPGQELTLYDMGIDGEFRQLDDELQSFAGFGTSLAPEDETFATRMRFQYDFSERLRIGLNASYSETERSSNTDNTFTEFTVEPNVPGNVFRDEVVFSFAAPLPLQTQEVDLWAGSFAGTIDYDLTDDWELSVDFSYSVGDNRSSRVNDLNDNFDNVVEDGFVIVNTQEERALLDFLEPVPVGDETYVTFNNVFGSLLGFNNIEQLNTAVVTPIQHTINKTVSEDYEASLRGQIFELPAGDITVDLSLSYRSSETQSINQNPSLGSSVLGAGDPSEGRLANTWDTTFGNHVEGVGFQALVPLISSDFGVPLVERLDLNVNTRIEGYSGTDLTGKNWSVGFNWGVSDWLIVRANRNHSLRIPFNVRTAGEQVITTRRHGIYDDDRLNLIRRVDGFELSGASPHLRPEENNGTTLGFIITPTFLENFRLSLNFSESETEGQIRSAGTTGRFTEESFETDSVESHPLLQFMTAELAEYYLGEIGEEPLVWDTTMVVRDRRFYNVGSTFNRGVDMSLSYTFSTDFGDWYMQWRHQYMETNEIVVTNLCDQLLDPTTPCEYFFGEQPNVPVDVVGVVDRRQGIATRRNGEDAIPQNRGTFELNWDYRGFGVNLSTTFREETVQLTGDVEDLSPRNANEFRVITTPTRSIDMSMTYDFSGDLFDAPEWLQSTRVQLSINDLWRQEQRIRRETTRADFEVAPFTQLESFRGLDARGRTFRLRVSSSF